MTLRTEAVSAYQSSVSKVETDARAALAAKVAPSTATGTMTKKDSGFVGEGSPFFVLSDGDLNVYVVQEDGAWDCYLVTGSVGNWTRQGSFDSLATLGKAIAALPAPPAPQYPEWVQPTGSTDAYVKGAIVTHNAKTWQSNLDANVWEPGVANWTDITNKTATLK